MKPVLLSLSFLMMSNLSFALSDFKCLGPAEKYISIEAKLEDGAFSYTKTIVDRREKTVEVFVQSATKGRETLTIVGDSMVRTGSEKVNFVLNFKTSTATLNIKNKTDSTYNLKCDLE